MVPKSNPIVFFGTDSFSDVSLRELLEKGFTVAAVVTKSDSRKGRGRVFVPSAVKTTALQHDIAVWQPEKLDELTPLITKLESPVGVLVSFGKIIPQRIIDLFTPGIINVHPSLLPRYRGPSPLETAILNGDMETGVTIMQLSAAMDAGPLYSQVTVTLNDTETAPELEDNLAALGAQELTTVLPSILDGSLKPTPQDDTVASYCQLLQKTDSLLDPSHLTATQAERRIRAHLAYPKTKVTIAGQPIVLTKAHVKDTQERILDITCADGRVLSIDELIGPSGKLMSASAFLNGYVKKS